tara:strand:+ start:152 stop:304 length:153 start_codon:yes stop_codon:yes gene_type:complete
MRCPSCEGELIWGGDHDYDDYGMDGDGIVSNLSCPNDNCTIETIIIYNKL